MVELGSSIESDAADGGNAPARLARIAHATLYEKVYAELRDALMSGRFAPGEALTIRGVAEALGTSVMPVREALRRLAAEGGVEILANRTMRVPFLDEARFADLLATRLLMECQAAALAAERITAAELEEAERLNADYAEQSGNDGAVTRLAANRRFHFAIYRAARSPLLLSLIEMMWLQSGPCLMAPMRWSARRGEDDTYFAAGLAHHREWLDALARHDGAASAQAIRADIVDAAAAYRDVLARRASQSRRAAAV